MSLLITIIRVVCRELYLAWSLRDSQHMSAEWMRKHHYYPPTYIEGRVKKARKALRGWKRAATPREIVERRAAEIQRAAEAK